MSYKPKLGDKLICHNVMTSRYNLTHKVTIGKIYEVVNVHNKHFYIVDDNGMFGYLEYEGNFLYHWKNYYRLYNNKPNLLKHLINEK